VFGPGTDAFGQDADAFGPDAGAFGTDTVAALAKRAELWELTGQLFRAIAADPVDRKAARAVGARLAEIGFSGPDALARTISVLGPSLSDAVGAGRIPAVFDVLSAVASGHGAAGRGQDIAIAGARQRADLAALRSAERARLVGATRFRAVFDQAAIGALVVADAGEIIEVNDTASQIVGRDLTDLSIGDVWDLVHPRDRAEVIKMWTAARAGRPGHGVWRLDRVAGPDGGPVWIAVTAAMVDDESGDSCFAVTVEDVTDRPDPRYAYEPGRIGLGAGRYAVRPLAAGASVDGLGRFGDTTDMFESDQELAAVAAARIQRSITSGLRAGRFVVHYQPIVRLRDGKIQGAEALVRWADPRRGLRTPEDFIGVAEESGLIVPLGLHVLETACQDAARWAAVAAAAGPSADGEPPVRPFVSVNLSVRQLQEPDLVPSILEIVERSGIEPGELQLELVESLRVAAVGRPLEALRELAAAGIRIAIDDFGTGYSNLDYLVMLPVHSLKIAGQFVGHLDGDDPDEARDAAADPADQVVECIVWVAHRIGQTVTVEGIETREQAARMLALGADLGQGHLFGHPMCVDKLAAAFAREAEAMDGSCGPHAASLRMATVPVARRRPLRGHAATRRPV
jgi:PAS domain S-box-containing protein